MKTSDGRRVVTIVVLEPPWMDEVGTWMYELWRDFASINKRHAVDYASRRLASQQLRGRLDNLEDVVADSLEGRVQLRGTQVWAKG